MPPGSGARTARPPGDGYAPPSSQATQEHSAATSSYGDSVSTSVDDAGANSDQNASWKGWAELENDPVIFSTLLREWGVTDIQVNEVIPLDAIFHQDPDSIYGLIFLSQWAPAETENPLTEAPSGVWFANQTSAFSCATVALMNIINNHAAIDLGQDLNAFRESTLNMTPKERGLALDGFDHVRDVHNSFATEFDIMNVDLRLKDEVMEAEKQRKAAMSKRPRKKRRDAEEDEEENGFHFVAYIPAAGAVWKMDGMERLPRQIVALSEGASWTTLVVPEIQAQLESATINGLECSLLSLMHTTDSSSLVADMMKMERVRENWGPFISQLLRIHAEKGTLRDELVELD